MHRSARATTGRILPVGKTAVGVLFARVGFHDSVGSTQQPHPLIQLPRSEVSLAERT
jgi:hypothetical protein